MASKQEWYRQCKFEMEVPGGKQVDVAWIPESLAKMNKKIYLTESPDEVYTVVSVGHRQLGSILKKKIQIGRKYRQTTDI